MEAWRSALEDVAVRQKRHFVARYSHSVQDTLLIPFRAATSKTAQRAYLGTALFTLSTLLLIAASSIAFVLFYNLYIPRIGLERTIHLQFG